MRPGEFLQRWYEVTGYPPRGAGAQKTGRCPGAGHKNGDRNPSLSARIDADKILLHCPVCGEEGKPAILEALRLTDADLFAEPLPADRHRATPDLWMPCGHTKVAEYQYVDEGGTLLYAVARCNLKGNGCQGFRQWRPDPGRRGGRRWSLKDQDGNLVVRMVPFRLPELIAAVAGDRVIWLVEGEKDALNVIEQGYAATCGAGGAGKGWRPEYTPYFQDADVAIVADRDPAGRRYAQQIVEALLPVARSIEVFQARHGKDATDHLAAGGTMADFISVWEPKVFEVAS